MAVGKWYVSCCDRVTLGECEIERVLVIAYPVSLRSVRIEGRGTVVGLQEVRFVCDRRYIYSLHERSGLKPTFYMKGGSSAYLVSRVAR